jgi:hypothetical protein
MRFGVMIAAGAAMLGAGQADAEVFRVQVNGYVTGTKITYGCDGQAYCSTPSYFAGFVSSGESFGIDLMEGANRFEFGGPGGFFAGTIINTGRVLTGINLNYATFGCARGSAPAFGCVDVQSATAAKFEVLGGIPEPTTWALMITGFGAIGAMLRRRRTAALRLA